MINETTEGQEAGDQREELFFKVIKAGNKILEILAALFIILMLLYGAYSLWDTCQINRRAFISGELMKYKPAGKTDESPSLQELQKINPDVCAWLTVDGTKIDYPVVQGETNLEYINQDIYGEFALSGSIFLDSRNDRKFIDDIEYAARELHPKFIALAGSPIPFMNGTDFPAIARVIETETGIPAFSVPTNGMNDYVYGAGIALEEIAKRFVREPDRQENRDPSSRTVNLLGVTPLDFGPQKNAETLKENLQKYGWQVMSVWAMGDDLKTLQRSAEADVNLVVSAVGLRVAKILWEKYKIPYVIGTPNDWLAEDISNALERAATRQAEPAVVYLQNRMQQEADITLVGEPVTMGSLAAGIEKRYGRAARVLCPLKECADLLGEKDKMVLGEEAMEEALKSAGIIVADPLYRPICPGDSIFYELPHVAFSGRIYF